MFAPKIPMLQAYTPANMHAADHDHDYLQLNRMDKFLTAKNLTSMTAAVASQIEKSTRGQNGDKAWHQERRKRITSSNFGKIYKVTPKTHLTKLAYSMLKPVNLDHVAAVRHGRQHGGIARKEYESSTGVIVDSVGLCVDMDHPYLAASPDGLIDSDTVIEIKCPYSAKDSPISVKTVPYLTKVDGRLTLDPKHQYFCQVQGQMMVTNREKC